MSNSVWIQLGPQDGGILARPSSGGLDEFFFTANSSMSTINQLRLAASKTVQSTSIALSSFNVLVAIATAVVISWDCYMGAKVRDSDFRLRSSWRTIVGGTDIFPLVLSLGIVVQGVIFIVVQASGFGGPLMSNCASNSRAMLPALFIVPYLHLVFGLESTFQAVRRQPFPKQSKWTSLICLIVVIAGLVGAHVVTRVNQPLSICIASLFWFLQSWGYGCFIVLLVITVILLLCALIILFQLHQSSTGAAVERMAASNMAYYLFLGSIWNIPVIPFFASISFQYSLDLYTVQVQSAIAAMVANNLSGIVFGLLYLYLRTSRQRQSAPGSLINLKNRRPTDSLRMWAPSPIFGAMIKQPISPPKLRKSPDSSRRSSVIGHEQDERNKTFQQARTMVLPNDPALKELKLCTKVKMEESQKPRTPVTPSRKVHNRKESYRLFPARKDSLVDASPTGLFPVQVYTPSITVKEAEEQYMLPLPPRIHAPGFISHRRGSSTSLISSATVQIGLRMSNISETTRLNSPYFQQNTSTVSLCENTDSPIEPSFVVEPLNVAKSTETLRNGKRAPVNLNKPHPPLPPTPDLRGEYNKEGEEQFTLSPAIYNPSSGPAKTDQSMAASNVSLLGDRSNTETTEWI
ncbi:hypothetical protein PT974_06705 [Cladobotryum mycophilum]|uniref:Uncharacterized protein n=1 Tax=Cladobotryum mycophilum TaxID=491253 RepID=A0ABR0SNH2_9HYPO